MCILAGHDNWITDLYFHPNGKFLISTADDKSIRMWDLSVGRCYRKIYNAHDHFISCFDMKGKLAATGSVDTSVKIWSCRWMNINKLMVALRLFIQYSIVFLNQQTQNNFGYFIVQMGARGHMDLNYTYKCNQIFYRHTTLIYFDW